MQEVLQADDPVSEGKLSWIIAQMPNIACGPGAKNSYPPALFKRALKKILNDNKPLSLPMLKEAAQSIRGKQLAV